MKSLMAVMDCFALLWVVMWLFINLYL